MQLTPEWVGVVLTALGMGGAAGAFIQRYISERRAALPIIRTSWRSGEKGRTATITIVNRLNEDLSFLKAEARTAFLVVTGNSGTPDAPEYIWAPVRSPIQLDWNVQAGKESSFKLVLSDGDCPKWLALTVSSSARTLRCKRLIIDDSQKP